MRTRIQNYQRPLIEWVQQQIGKAYEWGATDCGTLVRQGLHTIYGVDVFEGLPYWKTEEEARELWQSLGGVSVAFVGKYKAKKIERNYVRTGDVALLEIKNQQTALLVVNDKLLFSSVDKGVYLRSFKEFPEKLSIEFYRF